MNKYCFNCGVELESGSSRCHECGVKLVSSTISKPLNLNTSEKLYITNFLLLAANIFIFFIGVFYSYVRIYNNYLGNVRVSFYIGDPFYAIIFTGPLMFILGVWGVLRSKKDYDSDVISREQRIKSLILFWVILLFIFAMVVTMGEWDL